MMAGRKALVSFNEEERAAVEEAARADALPLATWVRRAAVLMARRVSLTQRVTPEPSREKNDSRPEKEEDFGIDSKRDGENPGRK